MGELPSGTVTYLFTDLEGSTRLWEQYPDAMGEALARHDDILRTAVEIHGGAVVKTTGDGLHAAFTTAEAAIGAAVAMQRALDEEPFEVTGQLRVRVGVHTGAADLRDGDYYGPALNRAARIMSAAHGGQIAVSHATEELLGETLADGFELVDLGEHRLRDLSRAERVFQLRAPGLQAEFPPLRSIDAFPGNLPLQLTSFVGRGQELNAITKALDTSRLVTLTGVGGVGKTRLAMQVAADVLPRFADGAWFCELAAANDADAMVQVVASTLGVNPRPGMTLEASIIEFLRPKRLLVVLDNCEHLLGVAARVADDVLRGCAGVCLLATSREGLGVEGERIWALRSLPLPDAAADRVSVETSDAVRLFTERATDAHVDFMLDESAALAVAEICRRLDGIPLAIELAAARVVAMSPGEIAGRLDERFRLLTGGRRTAVERHQTLRATVDWSYSMLDDRAQVVFDRLGVFAGSFDAPAAEVVVSGGDIESWDVLDALTELVAKSMVVAERTPNSTRYQLLETMRAYARERLDEEGDADSWRRRHAAHYAEFAEQAGPGLLGRDELVWRGRVREELDNLRVAVTWSLDRGTADDGHYALRILAPLAYLANQDRPTGVGQWAERAVELADRAPPRFRAPVLAAAAESLRGRGEMIEARAMAIAALRDGVPIDAPEACLAHVVVSVVDATLERYQESLDRMRAAVAEAEGLGDFAHTVLEGVAALMAIDLGDHATAYEFGATALRSARAVGNPTLLSIALYASAFAIEAEDPATADAHYDECLSLIESGAGRSVAAPAAFTSAALRAREFNAVGAASPTPRGHRLQP
jgi:predicted ATPase/class 3 adenylate cyclase